MLIWTHCLSYSGLTKLRALSKCLFNTGRPDALSCWDPSARQFLPKESQQHLVVCVSANLLMVHSSRACRALLRVLDSTGLELNPGSTVLVWMQSHPLQLLQPCPSASSSLSAPWTRSSHIPATCSKGSCEGQYHEHYQNPEKLHASPSPFIQ